MSTFSEDEAVKTDVLAAELCCHGLQAHQYA